MSRVQQVGRIQQKGSIQKRKHRYPQPRVWPGGTAVPFVAVLALLVALTIGLGISTRGTITWPDEQEVIETPIYRHPSPSFSSSLELSMAEEDTAQTPNESDWAIGWDFGRFFTQTNGQPEGTSRQGFGITDADDAEFWQAYKDLGGRRVLGFPLSRRFMYNGKITQVLQRAVFQWEAGSKSVSFLNVLDDLSAQGKDEWLTQEYQAPPPLPSDFDRGQMWGDVVKSRLELLAADGIILGAYYSVPDPLTLYGLPSSRVEDRGKFNIVRLQRAIIVHWKVDSDDPRAGQVLVIGAGEIAMRSGLFPAEVFVPEDPPVDQR